MAEEFNVAEFVVPGVFIAVRAEGLISVGGISTGNIGIVGTARRKDVLQNNTGRPILVPNEVGDIPLVTGGKLTVDGTTLQTTDDAANANALKVGGEPVTIKTEDVGNVILLNADGSPKLAGTSLATFKLYGQTHIVGDLATAEEMFGPYDAHSGGRLHLTRALEVAFRNGARTVYARALDLQDNGQPPSDMSAAYNELVKDEVNILIAPQLSTSGALNTLTPILESAENEGKDMMAVVGSDATTPSAVKAQVAANDRVILCAPGIMAFDRTGGREVALSGTYTAAAVAGLLATLSPQSSPTNKQLPGVGALSQMYSYSEIKDLVSNGVFVLEKRSGVRAVRGITTEMKDNGPFKQVTTRRIVDFAKAGIRQAGQPFIGRLNNVRVRAALAAAIDGFLTGMVQDEALTEYTLEVTATRAEEIAGIARVNAVLKPTFSIDFIAVTLTLQ